jgi:hypothetical protein
MPRRRQAKEPGLSVALVGCHRAACAVITRFTASV